MGFNWMNYLTDRFLPVRCSDGATARISVSECHLTEDGRTPIAADFTDNLLNDAVRELIAGVLQVACAPEDETAWAEVFRSGMTADGMGEAFAPFVPAFDVFGERGAFQDRTAAECKKWEVEKLFHESPGDQTRKFNKDFVGGRLDGISVPTAMMALYAIQAHAFACGPGYRVSIAGGGPLRVLPDMGASLFQKAWGCVLARDEFEALGDGSRDQARLLPWLSDWKGKLSIATVPASHLYFGTPRRIMLCQPTKSGVCPLTGIEGPLVTHILEGQNGLEYSDGGFTHPLSAYRSVKKGGKIEVTPVRAIALDQGVAWRERAGLVVARPDKDGGGVAPALAVQRWTGLRQRMVARGQPLRVLAYGVCCEQAKVSGSVRGVQSVALPDNGGEDERAFEGNLAAAVRAADQIAYLLGSSLKAAFFSANEREALKKARKTDVMDVLCDPPVASWWARTEADADDLTEDLRKVTPSDPARMETFLIRIAAKALGAFDDATGDAVIENPARVAVARERVRWAARASDVRTAAGLAIKERKSA